jgi:hypothetical protein
MDILKKMKYLLFLTMVVFSCTTNNDTDPSDEGDFFTAKVDGVDWAAFAGPPDTVAWNEAHTGLIVIQGSDSNGLAITMNIMNYTGTGTYDFTTAGFIQFVQGTTGAWACNSVLGTTGSVTITSDDGNIIEGTLSFVGKNANDNSTKTITEGSFRATKQ